MKYLFAFISFTFIFSLSAQELSVLNEYVILSNKKDSLEKVITLKDNFISQLQDSISLKDSQINALKRSVAGSYKSNSLMTDSVNQLKSQVALLQKERAKFDNVRMRYANGRLNLPYDKKNVDEALKLFSEIQDAGIKAEYVDLPNCLRDFPQAMVMVRATLAKLQKTTEEYNRVKLEEWKAEANGIIKTDPYTNSYAKQYRNGVSIYFLDDILEEAKTRINKATDPKKVSFEDLIIRVS